MDDVATKVRAEWARFKQALPSLMAGPHAGRWVVFLNGEVKSSHVDEAEALESAILKHGQDAGFVVARVEALDPTPLSASYVFGLR